MGVAWGNGPRADSDWGFGRFVRESRSYTRPMPWWRFYPAAVRRWPGFRRQQCLDNVQLGRS